MAGETVEVILFKPSGKYYTDEPWRIPSPEEMKLAGHGSGTVVGPYDMRHSPDFRRIGGGAVLIPSQEPWGFPHLFPGEAP